MPFQLTPKEYKKAIKEGVLYWNKSFGEDVLDVIDAPHGVSAPDFSHNIIQWVDWKTAGFAYADAQMDPRTGEILHAQVFLTSVFAFSSRTKAQKLLNRLLESKKHDHDRDHSHDPNHDQVLMNIIKKYYLNLPKKKTKTY